MASPYELAYELLYYNDEEIIIFMCAILGLFLA